MKHIDIVIPTRNRWGKLQRCLNSIPPALHGIELDIIVICDGDSDTASKLLHEVDGAVRRVLYVRKHSGSVFCRNLATQAVEDALIYATDDITFQPGSIATAVSAMRTKFPDEDGVIGFNQVNGAKFSIAGVGLVGQPFLRRYPNRKLFCPEYFHFSCQEIEFLGKKLGKIHLATGARIWHYHPMQRPGEHDQTHVEARARRERDKKLSSTRQSEGIIWGDVNG